MSISQQTEENVAVVLRAPKNAILGLASGTEQRTLLTRIADYLHGLALGAKPGVNNVALCVGSTAAAAEQARAVVTLAAVDVADTVTVNGQNFTAVAGTPAAEQFDQSG